jgi:hypothetical protein
MIDCADYGAGLYSPPSQASAVINQSQFSLAVRRDAYASSADVDSWSERRKKFLDRYCEHLVCVRYRYDEQRRKRGATVEIIVEESGWSPPERPVIVGLRVDFQEIELQRCVKQAGANGIPRSVSGKSAMIKPWRSVSRSEL